MTAALPKRISYRWLQQQRNVLACTRKTIDGEPNPSYTALAAEIEDAERDYQAWDLFLTWMSGRGFRLNQYPTRANGQQFEAGKVFVQKNKETRALDVEEIAVAWERFQERAV